METHSWNKWKKVKLIEVAQSIKAGGTPKRTVDEYWNNGNIPWLKISDLKSTYINYSREKITEEGLNNSSAKLFPEGTILYSIFATLGAIGILNFESTTNQAIAGIIPNNEIVNTKYLYYCLISEKKNIVAKKSRATQDNINLKILKNHEIPVPPLKTQQKIVEILEKAEKLKKWRAEADVLTDEYLKSVFLEMFGDPVKNPKGWEIKKLETLLDGSPVNGLYVPKDRYTESNGVEMVHMSDVFYEIVKRGNLKRIMINEEELKKYNLDYNDLLIARRSLNFEGAAKACKIPKSNEPLVFESSLIKITPNKDKILSIYLHHYLNNQRVRNKFVLKHITKSTISGINQKGLKSIKVVLPPLELQNQFAETVKKIEQLKQHQKQSKQQIDNLFNTLMQKAFKGELTC